MRSPISLVNLAAISQTRTFRDPNGRTSFCHLAIPCVRFAQVARCRSDTDAPSVHSWNRDAVIIIVLKQSFLHFRPYGGADLMAAPFLSGAAVPPKRDRLAVGQRRLASPLFLASA